MTVGAPNSRIVQRVRLVNRAPEDLVDYVDGFGTQGEVANRVELWLAADVALESFTVDGKPAAASFRERPHRTLVATNLRIGRGQSAELELTYTVPTPDGAYRARLLPQPLAQGARLEVALRAAQGRLTASEGVAPEPDGTLRAVGPFATTRTIGARLAGSD